MPFPRRQLGEVKSFFPKKGEDIFLVPNKIEGELELQKMGFNDGRYGEIEMSKDAFVFFKELEIGNKLLPEDIIRMINSHVVIDEKGKVKSLDFDYTTITVLPELPIDLEYLYCGLSPIEEIPSLPEGLKELFCDGTEISSLPELPLGLKVLNCSHTHIDRLPELPASLEYLNFSYTVVKVLPKLPVGLKNLECKGTFFSSNAEKKKELEQYCKENNIDLNIT